MTYKIKILTLLISCNIFADYQITVLATNISNYGGFGEWSFSALYESDKESILFDTGFHEDTGLHNAMILGKDLSKVNKVVLSHFHSDHTGGLIKLRKTYKNINKNAFSFKDSSKFKQKAEEEGIKFIILDDHMMISENLYVTGTVERTVEKYNGPMGFFLDEQLTIPDIIKDDQSVGMLTDKGWIMMSGCGHSVIINTAKKLQSIKNVPVYGAIGGFHLFKADNEIISKTANWLGDNGLTKFMGGHCTGIYAAETIAEIIGIPRENLSHTAIGSVLTKDLEIIRSSVE